MRRALEWLQGDRYEGRRLAAVLVLKELAENAPTLFYVHAKDFLDLKPSIHRSPAGVSELGPGSVGPGGW